jgi:hypothetical protein
MSYQIFFILLFMLTLVLMKFSSLVLNGQLKKDFKFLINSPLITPKTKNYNLKKTRQIKFEILFKFFIHSFTVLFFYDFYKVLFDHFQLSIIAKAYIFSIYIYLFTNFIAASARVFSLLAYEVPVDMHNRPYLSKSISEFWSVRWNKWIHDWLNLISKKCAPRSIKQRLFWAFFFSGIFHEMMFTLPYYLYFKENYMGTMMGYFMFQFLFMIIDRQVLKRHLPILRRPFMWFSVFAPLPLFINKPLLAFFGLS